MRIATILLKFEWGESKNKANFHEVSNNLVQNIFKRKGKCYGNNIR